MAIQSSTDRIVPIFVRISIDLLPACSVHTVPWICKYSLAVNTQKSTLSDTLKIHYSDIDPNRCIVMKKDTV